MPGRMNLVRTTACLLFVSSTNACIATPILAGVGAATPDEHRIDANDDEAIEAQKEIRVKTTDGKSVIGTPIEVDQNTIELKTKSGFVTVARENVAETWRRNGTMAGRYTLIGLGIDAAAITTFLAVSFAIAAVNLSHMRFF